MKKSKIKKLIVILVASLFVIAIVLFLVGFFKPKSAGLRIETQPSATVFVNGEQVGLTPYSDIYDPEEIVVKLVPVSLDKPMTPFETKVKLVSGVETVIFQEFSDVDEEASGAVISFEEAPSTSSSITVISSPDNAQISVDGIIKGYTPINTELIEGQHEIKITASSFLEKIIPVQVYKGYKVTVEAKLAKDLNSVTENKKTQEVPEEKAQVLVEILSTPTDFLRVRSEASTFASEVARVNPGETYKLISESDDGEWYQIEYTNDPESKLGWISSSYANKVDEKQTPTPTP